MKSLIIGYGSTGRSFERYLKKNTILFDIFDEDRKKLPDERALKTLSSATISSYEKLYVSPGVNLRKYFTPSEIDNLVFESDLDIFFKENESIKIGVTGTNGKSTLVSYLNQALNLASSSIALGNIGEPLLDHIEHKNKYSVIEVSSFQLEKMEKNNFDFSFITNIHKDHIDFHGDFETYKKEKLKICSEKGQTFFCDEDDYRNIAINFVKKLESYVINKQTKFINLPFRLEKVSEKFINDSKSTNSSSLFYALNRLDFKGDLIMCGNPAKEGYEQLKILGPRKVYIYGKHKIELSKLISHPNLSIHENLFEIFEILKKESNKELVLFSPGNPSGNDYKNYIERGEHFNKLKGEYFD